MQEHKTVPSPRSIANEKHPNSFENLEFGHSICRKNARQSPGLQWLCGTGTFRSHRTKWNFGGTVPSIEILMDA